MGSRKIWFIWLLIGVWAWGMAGCQGASGGDEAVLAEMERLQADLADLNTRTAELSGQVAASQAMTEAMLLAVAGSNQEAAAEAQGDTLSMSLEVALEIIHQDAQPPQSTFIPVDRLAFYPSLETFGMDWTGEKNTAARLKMAFLSNINQDAWQLYYTPDVISDEMNWSAPAWRRYLISANWQPAAGTPASVVPAELQVDQGDRQTIAGQTVLLDSPTLLAGLQNLQQAVGANGGDLTATTPIMFLVHDSSQGMDDLVLIIVDVAVGGPDPRANSPVRQYCSRCQGFWCKWRCWRWRK